MGVPRFWRAIPNRYNLIGSRCTSCGNYYYPKRVVCPHCRRRSEMTSYTFAGEGTVETFTEVYVTSTDFEREKRSISGREYGRSSEESVRMGIRASSTMVQSSRQSKRIAILDYGVGNLKSANLKE